MGEIRIYGCAWNWSSRKMKQLQKNSENKMAGCSCRGKFAFAMHGVAVMVAQRQRK